MTQWTDLPNLPLILPDLRRLELILGYDEAAHIVESIQEIQPDGKLVISLEGREPLEVNTATTLLHDLTDEGQFMVVFDNEKGSFSLSYE